MIKTPIRVRFAPAPTGTMHLGNIRTALMNYIFAKQRNGTLVLRIEDTDLQRNFDPNAQHIIAHLAWLGLQFDEGPVKGGPYEPYFQSQRMSLYQEKLAFLRTYNFVYRCFCTPQELEQKRDRQIALKIPPRYDRTCLARTHEEIERLCTNNTPFVWRFKLHHDQQVIIHDLARGDVAFELKNFSDFPLTRADGTFTFIFANFVDDLMMQITHVFRGEDHLSNTANQAALYHAFQTSLPIYWHMPILCNIHGHKLSKRDFGFSINDLQSGGFLPEAIDNYLAIIGGSFAQEIIPLDDLPRMIDFNNLHAAGQLKYDEQKLRWVNHQWIARLTLADLAQRCRPFLAAAYPSTTQLSDEQLGQLLTHIRTDLHTLTDSVSMLGFYFSRPSITTGDMQGCVEQAHRRSLHKILEQSLSNLHDPNTWATQIKESAAHANIPFKTVGSFIRMALTGQLKGLGIASLVALLGEHESAARLSHALHELSRI